MEVAPVFTNTRGTHHLEDARCTFDGDEREIVKEDKTRVGNRSSR